jgi:hypothetical protein
MMGMRRLAQATNSHRVCSEPRLEFREPPLELGIELVPPNAPLRIQLGQPLLELGVEPREVELVQLPEFSPIRCVHLIEPVHEFVCDLLTKAIVEQLG